MIRQALLRLPEVIARVGYSRSSLYAKIREKEFPAPIKLGDRAVAWLSSDVDDWITQRVAESRKE